MGGTSGGEMEMGSSSHGFLGPNFSPFGGLSFGKKVYFEGGDDGGSSSKGPTAPASSPPGATKKGQQRPRCQVEGCHVDLSGAKGYYSRHKVCVMHSKSPKVIVAGLEQRFCQQCSRFQKLHEFDQGKRSCRRRLADHNERRRKPPIGSLSSRIGRLSSSFHVNDSRLRGFLLDFTQPWTLGASKDEWPTTGSANLQASVHRLQSPIRGNQFSTVRNTRGERFEAASDSGCALSLLSTQPWGKTVARNGKPGLTPSVSSYGSPEAQPVATSSCMINSWGFKGRQGGVLSSEVQTEMGFGSGSARFSGELELALQRSRGCTDFEPGRECRPFDDAVDWSL